VLSMPLSGWMAHTLGWSGFFAASALLGLPGLLVLRRLKAFDPPAEAAPHLPLKTSSTVVENVSSEAAETWGACSEPLT